MSRPKAYDPEYGYQFQLFCRCGGVSWEHCDYATDFDNLDYLIAEYAMAYGAGWEFKWEQLPEKYWKEKPFSAIPITGCLLLDVTNFDIVKSNGYYRYVSHIHKIATSGWAALDKLQANKQTFLATELALRLCSERYNRLFGEKHADI